MELPDFNASFCDQFRVSTSLRIPGEALEQLLPHGGKRTKDHLSYMHQLKQKAGWIHFWVGLRRKRDAKETVDFQIGVHTIAPSKDTRETKSRSLDVLLQRLEQITGESKFSIDATFSFSRDQFKTTVRFPDDVAVGLGGPNGPNVKVAGLRLVFAAGPLESLIIDGDDRTIFVSSTMSVKASITDKLISDWFPQLSQVVQTLIIKNN